MMTLSSRPRKGFGCMGQLPYFRLVLLQLRTWKPLIAIYHLPLMAMERSGVSLEELEEPTYHHERRDFGFRTLRPVLRVPGSRIAMNVREMKEIWNENGRGNNSFIRNLLGG